jgi:hypothetical protein
LGKFEIIGTEHQARAAKALYTYLVESKGSTEPNTLLVHTHKLLDAIVRSKVVAEGHIGCLTDQVLCLSLMRPHSCFAMANVFTGTCARIAHGFFDTISHTARLKHGGYHNYVPIDQKPPLHERDTTAGDSCRDADDDDIEDVWNKPAAFTIDGEEGELFTEADFGMEDEEAEAARFREVDTQIEEELMGMEQENDDDDVDGQSTGELSAIISTLDLYMFIRGIQALSWMWSRRPNLQLWKRSRLC